MVLLHLENSELLRKRYISFLFFFTFITRKLQHHGMAGQGNSVQYTEKSSCSMDDEPSLMSGRESWIPLELCLCLFAHFQGGRCKNVPWWCQQATGTGHRQAGQERHRRAGSTTFSMWKSGRRLGEGQGQLSDDIPGPLRLLGLLLLSSVKPGFHPAPFVWFGNEDFKGHPWGQVSCADVQETLPKPGHLLSPPALALIPEST